MKTGKLLLGTLAGAAIGAIAGILLAPEKGAKTRKQIMDKGNDIVDELKSKFDKFSYALTKIFESTTKDVEELVDKGKANYYNAKKDVKDAMANSKNVDAANTVHSTY